MSKLQSLLDKNQEWASHKLGLDPKFFQRLANQQSPKFMWIGCADSRVPANEIVGLEPGEMFVHRNIANLAIATDINYLSVLAYAINNLKVEHVIVCGHYGCGGVKAVIENVRNGLFEHWLEPVRMTYRQEYDQISKLNGVVDKTNLLCELNVMAQVANVSKNIIVQDAWDRGQKLSIHGWIYGIADGVIKDLGVSVDKDSHPLDPLSNIPKFRI